MNKIFQIIQNPIILFMFFGVLIYGLDYKVNNDKYTIQIPKDHLSNLATRLQTQLGRKANKSELDYFYKEQIEQEILYREAKRLGLDQDDEIIKRRLNQKILFLLSQSNLKTPTDEDLKAFFLSQKYISTQKVSFQHIYFSNTEKTPELNIKQITQKNWQDLGEPFILQKLYLNRATAEIEQLFGYSFSQALLSQETKQWFGPIESYYGQHFVYLTNIKGGKKQSFEEVKNEVLTDYLRAKEIESLEKNIQKIKSKYTIQEKI